jgi:hypothetical protein
MNALRHGLAGSLCLAPQVVGEVDKLARAIAGEGANEERLGLAREIAEAEFTLRQIFRARAMHIPRQPEGTDLVASPNQKVSRIALRIAGHRKYPSPEHLAQISSSLGWSSNAPAYVLAPPTKRDVEREANAFDRYERRAFSRRNSAIKAFDALTKACEGAKALNDCQCRQWRHRPFTSSTAATTSEMSHAAILTIVAPAS